MRNPYVVIFYTLFGILLTGNVYAADDQRFALYTFNAGVGIADPVAIRVDTLTGESWFFNGKHMQAITETKDMKRYKKPTYYLKTVPSVSGAVVFRFSRANGSIWLYQKRGWVLLSNDSQQQVNYGQYK